MLEAEKKYIPLIADLTALQKKHAFHLIGKVSVIPTVDEDIEVEFHSRFANTYLEGPFLEFSVRQPICVTSEPVQGINVKTSTITIIDRDKLVTGVQHPCDGKKSHNRSSWEDTLKRNNCSTVGNDIKMPEN